MWDIRCAYNRVTGCAFVAFSLSLILAVEPTRFPMAGRTMALCSALCGGVAAQQSVAWLHPNSFLSAYEYRDLADGYGRLISRIDDETTGIRRHESVEQSISFDKTLLDRSGERRS